ncbi:MAG: tetratricopeptide repeat protein, partial [Gammaproteobacteria bacterium]
MQPIFPSFASQIVIDEVAVSENGNATTFTINFGLPLEYQKHFPRDIGEIVQIQLKLGEESDRELHKEVREGGELLTPGGEKSVLVYVTYEEGVPGGPYLTLRFTHPVRFDVRPGPNRKSVSIIVYDDKQDEIISGDKINSDEKSANPVDLMMAKARQSITFGNNKGAIDLLRKILRKKSHGHSQEAFELLGLALERDKQIPRAKYEYRKYLKSYPDGEGSARVSQRLAALRAIRAKPRRKLRRSKRAKRRDKIMTFGRFTQAYSEYYVDRELEGLAEDIEQELQQRLLSSNFSVKSRYRSEDRTVFGVFNASQSHDFLAGTTGREDDDIDESNIRRMYVDVNDQVYGIVGKVGRQSSRNGGVFGTFDGVVAGYRIKPRWLASVMVGKPIIRTFSDIDIYEKSFYGVKFDVVSEDKKFSNNVFFVQQQVDGILDRQAIGGDVRYSKKGLSIFGLLDYDLFYNDVSLFNVRVGWSYSKSNKLNFSFNRRQLYLTSRALEGMSVNTIDELLDVIPEKEIQRIAKERTRSNDTLTIGNSYQI